MLNRAIQSLHGLDAKCGTPPTFKCGPLPWSVANTLSDQGKRNWRTSFFGSQSELVKPLATDRRDVLAALRANDSRREGREAREVARSGVQRRRDFVHAVVNLVIGEAAESHPKRTPIALQPHDGSTPAALRVHHRCTTARNGLR